MGTHTALDRRQLLLGAAALPFAAHAAGPAEEAALREGVLELYAGLDEAQRAALCKPADHRHRQTVANAWFAGPPLFEILRPAQVELAQRAFVGLHHPEFVDALVHQVEEDNFAVGVNGLSLAFFGEPGGERGLGLVFAGRHVTRHWDERPLQPFAGPVFGGHASGTFDEEPHHPGNVWWFQGLAAHALFESLGARQREVALSDQSHLDRSECLQGPREPNGLSFADLRGERLERARRLVEALVVRPYRAAEAARAMAALEARGGVQALHLHFFRGEDLGGDGVYDNFEVWGPGFLCHFRGNPHPHSWLEVKA
jgi:hypothetical protein